MKKVISTAIASLTEQEADADIDHSREIIQTMDKEPRDQLTCVRVYDDFYRCNWWAPGILPGRSESIFQGLEISTYRIRKSHFVRAVIRDGQLVVEDATHKQSPLEEP